MKKLLVIALMLSLVGCSKKEEQPSQTYESIEAIKPTETQPIETPEIKETVEALVIEKTQFETAPMDSIEVIGVDENGNMQYMHSAGLDGHGCVFQRPHCGAKRPHVITDFPLLLS